MLSMAAQGVPIRGGSIAELTEPRPFGSSPFRAYDPGRGFGGLRGGCGCGPAGGCSCTGGLNGMRGLGQNASLDQLISNAFNWFGGVVQSNLPASAAVPPQYGSGGAIVTQVTQMVPYLIIGYLAYRLIK